jgi:hypothetical protein
MQVTIRKSFVIGAGVLLIIALTIGAYLAWWVWKNLGAELLLRDQQASVVVPEPMSVGIDILDDLDIMIDTVIDTTVPIDQTLTLPIKETLDVQVGFDNAVPIKMNVPLKDTIKLDQIIPVDGEVRARVLGKWITVPIKGELPVKADVPIDVNVPVDQLVKLQFNAPAKVDILEDLSVPLKADIKTSIPLKSAMQVPVRSRLRASATILEPADALIAEMDLKLPLREVGMAIRPRAVKSMRRHRRPRSSLDGALGALGLGGSCDCRGGAGVGICALHSYCYRYRFAGSACPVAFAGSPDRADPCRGGSGDHPEGACGGRRTF